MVTVRYILMNLIWIFTNVIIGIFYLTALTAGPRKVHQNALSQNAQNLRVLSERFWPNFIRFSVLASAKAKFYPNPRSGVAWGQKAFFMSKLQLRPYFRRSGVFFRLYEAQKMYY